MTEAAHEPTTPGLLQSRRAELDLAIDREMKRPALTV